MNYAELILPEFEQEMASTRKVLELVPDDKLDWKADEKMNSIGWNANHLVEIPGYVEGTLAAESWDIAGYQSPTFGSRAEVLEAFDLNVASAIKAIQTVDDDAMNAQWSLMMGDQALMTMPRSAVVRSFVINHAIHHRAHLLVYLRLNGISVPGMYGPGPNEEA